MSINDEIDDEYDDIQEYEDHDHLADGGEVEDVIRSTKAGLDPLDFSDPESAYLFLSDDAQDEIEGTGTKRLKCRSCGHIFRGESGDCCPECFDSNAREVTVKEQAEPY